ncbi:MAG: DUF559 domain-containing protein [Clostridia bacterium]|nr:DUF559 domain-containing protein [Clostridia bacterium]
MSLPYNEKLIPLAKTLRKNQTKQEKHLWYDFLKDCPVRFQRQKTIQTVEKVGLPQKNYLSMKSAGEKPLTLGEVSRSDGEGEKNENITTKKRNFNIRPRGFFLEKHFRLRSVFPI